MEELNKVLQALSVVERYEEYLFRKIWGRVLIVIGIVFPLAALISMNAVLVAGAIGLDAELISLLANVIAFVLCGGFMRCRCIERHIGSFGRGGTGRE